MGWGRGQNLGGIRRGWGELLLRVGGDRTGEAFSFAGELMVEPPLAEAVYPSARTVGEGVVGTGTWDSLPSSSQRHLAGERTPLA